MNILKQVFTYSLWLILSLLIGLGYMKILIGATTEPTTALLFLLNMFYTYGVLYVGTIIGLFIALIFILLDIFYLKKKLKSNSKRMPIRFGLLIVIAVFVGVIHYVLEKVIDII